MNKIISFCLVMIVTLSGCANEKVIDGVNYETYGLINEDEAKDPNIQYRVVNGNIFWGIVLFETIIAPVYFFGYALHEPVSLKAPREKP